MHTYRDNNSNNKMNKEQTETSIFIFARESIKTPK